MSSYAQNSDDKLHPRTFELMQKAQAKTLSKDERKELIQKGFAVQNKGFILEENERKYKSSLVKIDEALLIWRAMSDTLREANLLKFRAMLLGRLGNFVEAKSDGAKALYLYRSKKNQQGVAVTYFDLSKVYEYENKLDSALILATSSASYWKTVPDTFRIVVTNNLLLNLYLKSRQMEQARSTQLELSQLVKFSDLHALQFLDYYFLSLQFFKELQDTLNIDRYKKMYSEISKSQKKKGYNSRSIYDQ